MKKLMRIHRAIVQTLLLLLGLILHAAAADYTQNIGTVTVGKARFQFLSESLLRLEYASDGRFTDVATAVVQNRYWKTVPVDVREVYEGDDLTIVIANNVATIHYKLNSGPFTKSNLKINWVDGKGSHLWTLGTVDSMNLGGLAYSLDGARTSKLPGFRPGILSRSGYFLLDDSKSPLWNAKTQWIEPRKDTTAQDMYFFFYGSDYKHVLREYAELCGPIPMIPRYSLGTWITDLNYEYLPGTEYVDKYTYNDEDIKKLIERFRREELPLDVLVLDFAWHKYGWQGGYDWSPIFPQPKKFLSWAHEQGVKVSVNDHPGYGSESVLSDSDSRASAIRKSLGMPVPPKPKVYIPITGPWKFHTDPDTAQWQHNWASVQLNDSAWASLNGGALWEDQGYENYDGMAWYRKWVDMPAKIPQPFYLIFGGVDDEYDLFINGQRIAHHGNSPYGSVYSTITWTDVSNVVKPGAKNLITVRVNDWGGGGGLGQNPIALSDRIPFQGIHLNLADKKQATEYMKVLHNPVIDQGVDFWWIDGGSGSCDMEGLNSQMWTNKVFYDMTAEHTGKRGFVFSRYGGWGSHRYPSLFTGDTYSEWSVLNFEVPFTAQGGNVLMPYITHDIGGFQNDTISFDLWARWLEFGAFSPFLRLHSAHENPKEGNVRMPWTYGQQGIDLARKYLTLRTAMIPYLYSYCREATQGALPLCRPLYLEYPEVEESYNYPGEYLLGREMLVAPVTDSSGLKDIYLPAGTWYNYFTGKQYGGGQVFHEQYGIDETPLFVKSGAVVPTVPARHSSDARDLDTLIVDWYGPGEGTFHLYEDDGVSKAYLKGEFATTRITAGYSGTVITFNIDPTVGSFKGQEKARAYRLRLHMGSVPETISVDGVQLRQGMWRYDETGHVAQIDLSSRNIRKAIKLVVR